MTLAPTPHWLLQLAILLLTAGIVACASPPISAETCVTGTAVGDCAPDFVLADQNGELLSLEQERSKVDAVVLVFGEMWCPLCSMFTLKLDELAGDFAQTEVLALAVLDEDYSGGAVEEVDVAAYAEELGLDFPVLADPDGETSEPYEYGMLRPRAYVMDRDGLIHERVSGFSDDRVDELRDVVEDLVSGPTS